MKKFDAYVILDNIRSAENVGSIFRTSDALNIKKIFLIGITPAPTDRFGRVQKKIAKVALGAEKTVQWERKEKLIELLRKMKGTGVEVVAVEQSPKAKDYKEFSVMRDSAFVFGSEVDGLGEDVLSECDSVVEIPMSGKKESLNVSVALGVALFRILDN